MKVQVVMIEEQLWRGKDVCWKKAIAFGDKIYEVSPGKMSEKRSPRPKFLGFFSKNV